jgi:hypothetical protein
MQCVDKSLVLDTNLSKELTVHSITEDVSNIKTWYRGGREEIPGAFAATASAHVDVKHRQSESSRGNGVQ